MKKLTLFLVVAILLTACGPKPQDVVNSWQAALNKGDIDAALSYLADDAAVTIIPPADGDGVYNGHAEIRGWYESLAAGNGVTTLSDCQVNGETVTCLDKYADEGLKAMGVDFIEGDWVAVIRDGKIQSYTFTITPESLAKFPPPAASTPELSEDVRIVSAEAIIGKWEGKYLSNTLPHEFRADGLLIVSIKGKYVISKGKYWFEDGLLKMNDNEGDCAEALGVYEVYPTYEGDHATKLRFVLVGDDACESRKNTLAGGLLAVPVSSSTEPPVAAPTLSPEAPIGSAEDVIGVWGVRYDGDPYLMEFKADGFFWVGWEGNRTGLASGKYAVVGNQLHFLTQDGSVDAIYEVYVVKQNGKPVVLRFVVVGDDPDTNRKSTLDGKTLKPAAP